MSTPLNDGRRLSEPTGEKSFGEKRFVHHFLRQQLIGVRGFKAREGMLISRSCPPSPGSDLKGYSYKTQRRTLTFLSVGQWESVLEIKPWGVASCSSKFRDNPLTAAETSRGRMKSPIKQLNLRQLSPRLVKSHLLNHIVLDSTDSSHQELARVRE